MDSSTVTSPDKHGSDASQTLESSNPKSDAASSVITCQRERRRREHNDMEKKRKEQIKACICRMGELLPPNYVTNERHSTLEIVEKSLSFMRELKEARTKFAATEESLQQEIELLKKERDKFSEIIKAAGLSTESIPTNGVSSTTDPRDESPKPKNKNKKRNTLSSQMQQMQEQREKQQQQEMISSSVSVTEDGSLNMPQNSLMNIPGGAFMNGQNVMFNPMMNQFMMPGMMGNGNQMMPNIGPMGMMSAGSSNSNMAGITNNSTNQNNSHHDQSSNGMNKSMEESDAGLLQLAMQDAGITPGSSSGPQSSSALTPVSDTVQEVESSSSQNNPLQTLASVATSEHLLGCETSEAENQPSSMPLTGSMSTNLQQTVMTSVQSGLQSMMQTGNGGLINMSMMGHQSGLPGQQQMQQIMIINEQGIPMIANVPVGIDPNNPNLFGHSQKGGLMSGMNQQNMMKDQNGGMDQNALALAQQQANMAAFQNQLLGQNNVGNLQNMPFQQNLLQGNIIQTPNGQLLQQIGPQISGPGQLLGMQGQGQGIVVAGQQGQLTLNTMPSQPNQLPSALILPNGQIIPVVTNPGNVMSQSGLTLSQGHLTQGHLTQPRMSGPHMPTGMEGQLMTGANSQGLLIPAASSGQLMVSSATASLSTSVVPTSAIQSVMTTQVQVHGSTLQTQRPISSTTVSGLSSGGSSSTQTRLINIPQSVISSVASGGKASGTPILISLPINGQLTTVLLDPTTMQVLGTVQPGGQQPVPSQQGVTGVAVSAVPTSATASSQQGTTTNAGNKNKNKNNANQRAICPKPLGGDGFRTQSTPAKKKRPSSKSNSKSKETAPADSLSETLQIQIPESTTDLEVSSAVSTESTDILAKAAESIFSPATGDIGSVGGGFYNPANEDNPLHIDTSVMEVEDNSKSPSKHSKKASGNNDGTLQDSVLGLNSVEEGGKAINVTKVVDHSEKLDDAGNDNVSSLSATLEEFTSMQFGETIASLSDKSNDVIMVSETKVSKKSKPTQSSKSSEAKKVTESKSGNKSNNKGGKSSKKNMQDKNDPIDLDKMDTDSQLDIESTLIHIPDNITFSENDLTDVLDQYEQLGDTVPEISNKNLSKKSKSKRSKPADLESEPNSKKRKSGKDEKDASVKAGTPAKEILSMPTSLSVYDFDDSDDIVPSILPLNGKDFTALSSTPPRTSFNATDLEENNSLKIDSKSSKNSAQSKTKKSSKSANVKTSKDADLSFPKETNDDVSSKESVVKSQEKSENDKKTYQENTKESKTEKSTNEMPVSLPSMPEIDTTTSLFGFPVPKKLQRPEKVANRAQNTQKPTPQVSPKPSSQAQTPIVSPKPSIVSPKSTPSMVSPIPNSFSPEMLSPKLSIVSPSQTMLSDTDQSAASPKQYTEISPLKKKSPEHTETMKLSTFSALNSVPMSEPLNRELFTQAEDKKDSMPSSNVHSQSTGVITSVKTTSSANFDCKTSVSEAPKLNIDSSGSAGNVPKMSTSENVQMLPNNSVSNNTGNKTATSTANSRSNNVTVENKFNTSNVAVSNSVSNHRTVNTANVSQNNRYSSQFNSNPNYDSLVSMDNRGLSKDNSSRSKLGIGNYPVPYSAESLFNSHSEKAIKSPPNVNISTLNQKPDTSNMSKLRNNNNPYSVDNFVQSSRDEGLRSRPNTLVSHPDLMSSSDLGNPASDFSRLQAESSPDGFNFANIGLNLQPITSNLPGSLIDNSTATTSNMAAPFSFSLSSSSSTITTSSGGLGHHQFPFFPPPPSLSSSSSNVPSQTSLPSSMPNMYDQNASNNNVIQRNNTVMHPPSGNIMSRGDNSHISRVDSNNVQRGGDSMQRNDKGPTPIRPDDPNQDQSDKPSCSKQKLPKNPGPATIQEPFSNFSNTSGGPDNNFFQETQMKSSVGKSPTEQMRKPDKMMDMNSSHSRSSSAQSNMSDKRGSAMERSPQMMNSSQPYFPSGYPSSKSLNTPPLHHPSMMPPDDRARNMTNRSPYEPAFPPSSQGFNPMIPGYPGNRFDSGPPSFSRDNSGTQPLSHTPVNSGGRKSANPQPPQQSSVVKPPQKQPAPPLVPMGGPTQQPPSQPQRPSQQNHRANTPHGSQPGVAPTPSASQSRPTKQPSRNSKPPSSKKSKPLPFMEVDSNLSNSIFENRSMTPFFPMQNLSPQSRMQHEGSPLFPGNFFGAGPRFPNSNTPMPKNSDIGTPFNPLFPPRAAQNGLGFNFQPGFGMNPLHGNHGNGSQLTPHTASHMANFNLNNIFSDGASQNESSLNISPIKFPHTNYQGMEHNAMQHHHQYNRGPPSVMSINSILGPNHHGFDGRMNTSMAGPFHHSHPSFIPPLNFSMHDH